MYVCVCVSIWLYMYLQIAIDTHTLPIGSISLETLINREQLWKEHFGRTTFHLSLCMFLYTSNSSKAVFTRNIHDANSQWKTSKHNVYINNVLIRKYSVITTIANSWRRTICEGGEGSGQRKWKLTNSQGRRLGCCGVHDPTAIWYGNSLVIILITQKERVFPMF